MLSWKITDRRPEPGERGPDPARWICAHHVGGDHPARHVHVFRDDVLVLEWDLEANVPITGRPTRLLTELREEGRL